eukprot:TRINITY_DN71245_c0_g1_i1.p1 TRINITY_DN71245_c0_g1~~TRINITY_DN71245_c0_g1_i1.p1  ORF type:complete len:350 (-),score=43.21 TRINITY_DN71245_c0_g1_i1:469-1518(-)
MHVFGNIVSFVVALRHQKTQKRDRDRDRDHDHVASCESGSCTHKAHTHSHGGHNYNSHPPPSPSKHEHRHTAHGFAGFHGNTIASVYDIHDEPLGQSGSVFVATDRATDERVAMKRLHEGSAELSFLQTIQHANIVRLIGTAVDREGSFLVLEYVHGTTLRLLSLGHRPQGLPTPVLQRCAAQACSALAYLHSLNVAHGNLQPSNIIVDTRTGIVKLLDLKLANFSERTDESEAHLSTPTSLGWPQRILGATEYMAPELLMCGARPSPATDMWAFGVVFLEAAVGQAVWPAGLQGYELIVHIASEAPRIPCSLQGELRELLSLTLQLEPKARPCATDVQRHTFLAGLSQ